MISKLVLSGGNSDSPNLIKPPNSSQIFVSLDKNYFLRISTNTEFKFNYWGVLQNKYAKM